MTRLARIVILTVFAIGAVIIVAATIRQLWCRNTPSLPGGYKVKLFDDGYSILAPPGVAMQSYLGVTGVAVDTNVVEVAVVHDRFIIANRDKNMDGNPESPPFIVVVDTTLGTVWNGVRPEELNGLVGVEMSSLRFRRMPCSGVP